MEHMPILKKCFKQCISPYAASTNVLSFTTCIAVKHRLVRSTKRSTSHLKSYAEFYACTILCVPKFSRQLRYYCTITGTTGTTDHLFKASNVSPSLFYISNSKKIPCIFYRIKKLYIIYSCDNELCYVSLVVIHDFSISSNSNVCRLARR